MHSQTWAKHIPQTLRVSFILPVIPSVSLTVDWWFLYYDKFYEGILKFGVMGKKERDGQDKGEMETHHCLQLASVK